MSLIEIAQFHAIGLFADAVKVNPNPNGLPGVNAFQKLLNGAVVLAGMACALGFIIGAAQWGIGSKSHNYSQAADGRERMLKSAAGAFGIGAVAAIINFFYTAGTGVK